MFMRMSKRYSICACPSGGPASQAVSPSPASRPEKSPPQLAALLTKTAPSKISHSIAAFDLHSSFFLAVASKVFSLGEVRHLETVGVDK